MRQVLVWDLATRLFHWLLVLFVVAYLFQQIDYSAKIAAFATNDDARKHKNDHD